MDEVAQNKLEEATNLRNNGLENEAIPIYKELRNQYSEAGDITNAARMAQEIGVCHIILSQKSEAIEWYEKALEEFTSEDNKVAVGNVQRDIGLAYTYDSDYTKAFDWLQKSCRTLQEQDNYDALGITLVKMGMVQNHLKRPDEAYRNIIEGLKVIRASAERNWFFEMTGLLELGKVMLEQTDYWRAISALREGLSIISEEDAEQYQARRVGELYINLALAYLHIPDADRAADRFIRAMLAWEKMDTDAIKVVVDMVDIEGFLDALSGHNQQLEGNCRRAYQSLL